MPSDVKGHNYNFIGDSWKNINFATYTSVTESKILSEIVQPADLIYYSHFVSIACICCLDS